MVIINMKLAETSNFLNHILLPKWKNENMILQSYSLWCLKPFRAVYVKIYFTDNSEKMMKCCELLLLFATQFDFWHKPKDIIYIRYHFAIIVNYFLVSRVFSKFQYRANGSLEISALASPHYHLHWDRHRQTCKWDPRDYARAGRHTSKSVCQRDWSRRQHNKFYRKSRRQKFLFFWRLKRDLSLKFCVCHKKSKIMNRTKHFITTIYM